MVLVAKGGIVSLFVDDKQDETLGSYVNGETGKEIGKLENDEIAKEENNIIEKLKLTWCAPFAN